MNNPAVIYTRFSPRPIKRKDGKPCTADEKAAEAEKIQSINTQIDACTRYCGAKELSVLEVIRDPLTSARSIPLKHRPGGQRLLELLDSRVAKHIVVQKVDRLFRDIDERHWLRKWQKSGVVLHLADQGGCSIDCSTATGKMFMTMLMTFAEFEPGLAAERTKKSMLYYQSEGRVMSKRPPYGMKIVDGKLVKCPVEMNIVKWILSLRDGDCSVSTIVCHLNGSTFSSRSGKPWHPENVKRIIKRYAK